MDRPSGSAESTDPQGGTFMSEARISELEEIKKDPNDVYVFISYSHEDFGIAQCLQDELIAVNPDRVRCFLDAYSIRSGEEWHSKIIANLKAADWLVFLYTGRERRPYDFCGFEIGIFTSVHSLDTSRKITEAARLLCLHDKGGVPSLLSMVQNRRIRPYQSDGSIETTKEFDFYVDSPLAQFFEDFYQYPANMPLRRMLKRSPGGGSQLREMPNIAAEIVDCVKRLTIKFQEARKNDPISEKFYQVRMEIDIRDPLAKNKNDIPGRSTVTAMQDAFNLLGLSPDPDEDGQLKTTWEQMKTSLETNNETFAWMDKVEDDIIEAGQELMEKLGDDVTDAEFQLACRQIIYDIERMEHESSEFGMNSPDLFQQAFGPENHEIVNAFYEIWFPVRKDLFALIERRLEDPSAVSRENVREEIKKF